MIPTVEQCYDNACFLLGDPGKQKFKQSKLEGGFVNAYHELVNQLNLHGVRRFRSIANYTLAPFTTSLTPLTAGITNFGAFQTIEERPSGTTEEYVPIAGPKPHLDQRDPDSRLGQFEFRGDTFYFIGATAAMDLRITYWASDTAPTSGTVGIDNCLPYFGAKIAGLAGPPNGFSLPLAAKYLADAKGYLDTIIAIIVKAQQNQPLQDPDYNARNPDLWPMGRPPYSSQ